MKLYTFCSIFALIPTLSFAIPKFETTSLPLPTNIKMDETDKLAINFIVGLSVHQDSSDPNQYYYVPKFKAVNYEDGSLSYTNNVESVSSYSQIKEISDKKSSIIVDEYFTALNSRDQWQLALDAAKRENNQDKIDRFKVYLKEAEDKLNTINIKNNQYTSLLPVGLVKTLNNKISDLFSYAGFPFNLPDNEPIETTNYRIRETTAQIVSSNGGSLTSNIIAGFSSDEINYIRIYKTKYAPNIKISLLPVDKITFRPLTELVYDSTGKKTLANGTPLYLKMGGGGNFTGSTINFDLTVAGSLAFARRNGPFILPVSLNATTSLKLEPFHAILNCDFSTGWSLKGRADVRDGLVVYNNDITMNMDGTDTSTGGCKMNLISGDINSASYGVLKALDAELTSLQIKKTLLAAEDKKAYWESVQRDVQNNRHSGANSGFQNVFAAFTRSGWGGAFVSAFSAASNFYWHTNIQNVNMLSNVKIYKEIIENGSTKAEIPIAADICYVWNTKIKAYKTCTPEQQREAVPLTDATQQAAKSTVCSGMSDAIQCGERRNERAPVDQNGDILPGSF
ncbi:hypothetical protein [Fluviispira sanaruensis]|uniref:Uncharacterized protein n=1 Tax=Fluviispira sanaruensis TaxID=2493639 RepID=A0A4P2VZH8_FLUSA|nr:hypothetical protein [Fluviispira sanaruensis]BBH54282.1 hypothetical protein JCM31447_27460 [Fluviispira sanaruensis]